MDGGVADTARANTKNSCEHKPLIGESWGKRERRTSICASLVPPFPRMYSRGTNRTAVRSGHSCRSTHAKRVQDTIWDTHQIHQDTCILSASLVSHWIHFTIHQDTCILDSLSRYIKIHRDTKSRYMYLGRVMTTLHDTIRIHHDTCILDASSEPRWIHTRYARDTQQIHQGYVSWARSICPAVQGAEGAPPLRRSSRAPLGARVEGLAPVPFDCSP
mgnify:FL=1